MINDDTFGKNIRERGWLDKVEFDGVKKEWKEESHQGSFF